MEAESNTASSLISLLRAADVHRGIYLKSDQDLFESQLANFVPPEAFDVHAHLYDLRHLVPDAPPDLFAGDPQIDHNVMVDTMSQWMGDRVVRNGLYFPFPLRDLDCRAANSFLAEAIRGLPDSRGLMMIRPQDDPNDVETQLQKHGFVGFKVYHVFASRQDTLEAEAGEFLPEWAWELANQRGLAIMLHLVLARAISDPRNQSYIREQSQRYPHAKLVLAHAARGFNARHTIDGIGSLRSLDNVFYDTSAVCEPSALEAVLRTCGPSRLMYGSDFAVSEMRGRCVSIGDGFYWLHDHNAEWDGWPLGQPQLIGIESLLALQQACRTLALVDSDIERIFSRNARQLLGLSSPTGDKGHSLYRHAKHLIPGGTQLLSKRPEMFAPGQWPAYYEQAIGCEVIDSDGRRFIDMSSSGILSCILGFADPDVNAAVLRRVHLGAMATQQTVDEVELARLLIEIHPWAEQARFTRGGGEAMAVAVRIARAATGRSRLAICGYHGWHDWYLAANLADGDGRNPAHDPGGSNSIRQLDKHLLPGLRPTGVPRELAGTVATFHYNRLDELDEAIRKCGDDMAAIVMEPTRNIDPDIGFLQSVRERAERCGAALIFDEISVGWRMCLGGAHRLYGITPDIAVFAKAMSNGFAIGTVIGRAEIMQAAQDAFISSTYWTEGIGPAAAVAAIKKMMRIDVPKHLATIGSRVIDGWRTLGEKHKLPLTISGRPVLCSFSFAHPQNDALMTLFTTRMIDEGFLASGSFAPTLAHDTYHVERYLDALDRVFKELADAVAADDVVSRLRGPVKHSTFTRLVD